MLTERIVAASDRAEPKARRDFRLGIATVTENVTMVGEAPLVEVNKSQPSSVITGQQIESLPTLSCNFQVLAQLLPGAKPGNQSGTGSLTGTVTNFGGSRRLRRAAAAARLAAPSRR